MKRWTNGLPGATKRLGANLALRGLSVSQSGCARIPMMARSKIAPLQRPNTLMQLSRSSVLELPLATRGRASAARLAAIPAGESPANRDAMGRAARTMAPSSLKRINGATHATAERFEQIPRNSRTRCNTDRRDRDGSVELARRRYRAWRRAPAVEKARGRRKRITEVAASMARGSGAGRTQDQTHRCRFRGRPRRLLAGALAEGARHRGPCHSS